LKGPEDEASTAAFYLDILGGVQNVQAQFARLVGFEKPTFPMAQLAGGIKFFGLLNVGFQKYFAPSQPFNVNSSAFKQWHLVVQFAPNGKRQ
jgi:hypothetical protein